MLTLGIESSCDETGLAIYDSHRGLLAHALYSQVGLHKDYGGVVPELASRDHIRKTIPLIRQVLQEASLKLPQIEGIAYTSGPGLAGALMVGASIGRGLAWSLGIPAVAIHHMEGHLLAPLLERDPPTFPFVALLISGGHTQLVHVQAIGQYHLLGESIDDAAGEAFDKTAKMLGLPYPGGPQLAKLAQQGDPKRFSFPRPMTDRPGLDFSFSGLKTFALNTLLDFDPATRDEQLKADIARAFEDAVIDTLLIKCRRAMKQTALRSLILAGGVSANQQLRRRITREMEHLKVCCFFPRTEFCTDNGAMIAFAGSLRLQAGQRETASFSVRPRWPLNELPGPT